MIDSLFYCGIFKRKDFLTVEGFFKKAENR